MTFEKRVEKILLEFESDGKDGYWHEPRTLKQILKAHQAELREIIKEIEKEIEIHHENNKQYNYETVNVPYCDGLNKAIKKLKKRL